MSRGTEAGGVTSGSITHDTCHLVRLTSIEGGGGEGGRAERMGENEQVFLASLFPSACYPT